MPSGLDVSGAYIFTDSTVIGVGFKRRLNQSRASGSTDPMWFLEEGAGLGAANQYRAQILFDRLRTRPLREFYPAPSCFK